MIEIYDNTFQEGGSEIYVKSAALYFKDLPVKAKFSDLMSIANKREEICIGVRFNHLSKNPDRNFGVELNLPKNKVIEITEKDYLVVLSEDDL